MNLDIRRCIEDYSEECIKKLITLRDEEELKEALLNIKNLNKKYLNPELRN